MAPAKLAEVRLDLEAVNRDLAGAEPRAVVEWAHAEFGDGLVLSSSFGVQAAVMLHLATRVVPDIPVVFVDTGYLFPETYRFARALTERLGLNVKTFVPRMTAAQQEALYGRLWKGEGAEVDRYYEINKTEPMRRALDELGASAWLAGLRAQQTKHRAALRTVEMQDGRVKVHPILRWSSRDVFEYLKEHDLPYHPLFDQGYPSIGDWHSTRKVGEGGDERDGRFEDGREECGLHVPASAGEDQSRGSSGL